MGIGNRDATLSKKKSYVFFWYYLNFNVVVEVVGATWGVGDLVDVDDRLLWTIKQPISRR